MQLSLNISAVDTVDNLFIFFFYHIDRILDVLG